MNRHKGFTIIELLIAVSIFSVIALCLYSTFSGGIKIWRRQEQGLLYINSMRLALDKMGKELRNAVHYSIPGKRIFEDGETQDLRFIGEKKKVSFMTVAGKDIARVSYLFEEGADREGTLKRKIALQKDGFKEKDQNGEVLIAGVDDLSFEYADGGQNKDSAPVWSGSWGLEDGDEEAAPKIPRGVRIVLTFKKGGENQDAREIFTKTVFIAQGALAKKEGL